MHSEAWGDPREHRGGGHRMRMRMRGGPGPGPGAWGGGPFEFGMRGGPFAPPRFGGRGPRVRRADPGRLAAERGVGVPGAAAAGGRGPDPGGGRRGPAPDVHAERGRPRVR